MTDKNSERNPSAIDPIYDSLYRRMEEAATLGEMDEIDEISGQLEELAQQNLEIAGQQRALSLAHIMDCQTTIKQDPDLSEAQRTIRLALTKKAERQIQAAYKNYQDRITQVGMQIKKCILLASESTEYRNAA